MTEELRAAAESLRRARSFCPTIFGKERINRATHDVEEILAMVERSNIVLTEEEARDNENTKGSSQADSPRPS